MSNRPRNIAGRRLYQFTFAGDKGSNFALIPSYSKALSLSSVRQWLFFRCRELWGRSQLWWCCHRGSELLVAGGYRRRCFFAPTCRAKLSRIACQLRRCHLWPPSLTRMRRPRANPRYFSLVCQSSDARFHCMMSSGSLHAAQTVSRVGLYKGLNCNLQPGTYLLWAGFIMSWNSSITLKCPRSMPSPLR